VYDLDWARGVKYGEVRLRDEVEQSKYAFGQVDMPEGEFARFHKNLFTEYYGCADALLKSGLVLPALDYCLKCSHAFNLLDSSGSIGVTERTAYILKVRQLAVAIAGAWTADPIAQGAGSSSAKSQPMVSGRREPFPLVVSDRTEPLPPVVSGRREPNHGS
jgi:glycyl-tRNA synthetase alpha subunit